MLCTGRSWHGTKPLVDETGSAARTVGLLQRRGDRRATHRRRSSRRSPSIRGTVITQVEEFAPGTLIAVEEIGRGYRLNEHFPGGDLTGEMIIEDVEQLSSRPVTRVILRDPTRSDEDFIALARHLGLHGVTYFVGWSAWLDIAPEGVNKATALAEVAAGFGVSAADVLAFGDGRNDIEMLRWAGRGVAIGDAPAEVRAAADDVTDPFADGGPVAELRHWFG